MAVERFRNFATIAYPESMSKTIWDDIDDLHIECYVSPLHDKDINRKTGELKKAHYHIVFCYDGKKSIDQVKAVVDRLGCVGLEVVESKKSYLRYLCHLDSADKVEYNVEDVKCFGGANYEAYKEEGYNASALALEKEILKHIVMERIYSYSDLVITAMEEEKNDWLALLLGRKGLSIREFQKSLQWTDKHEFEWEGIQQNITM